MIRKTLGFARFVVCAGALALLGSCTSPFGITIRNVSGLTGVWSSNDIESVMLMRSFNGAPRGSLRVLEYSEDENDLADWVCLLNEMVFPTSSRPSVPGSSYLECAFMAGSQSCLFRICEGLLESDGEYYKFPKGEDAFDLNHVSYTHYRLQTYRSTPCVANPCGIPNAEVEFNGLGLIEFIESSVGCFESQPCFSITDGNFVSSELLVYGPKLFTYQNRFFEVVSESDFSALFA